MSKKHKILIIVLLIVLYGIFRIADIKFTWTESLIFVLILCFAWLASRLELQERELSNSLLELNQKLDNLNEDINIIQKKLRMNKVKSYISGIQINLKESFLLKKIRDLDFDPNNDFDDFETNIFFTYAIDLISELEFVVTEGNIFAGSSYVFQCARFKNGVLEKKYPGKPFIGIGTNHMVTVESNETIEFFTFSPLVNSEKGHRVPVGCFPYSHLVGKLMEFYRMYFHEEIESEDSFLQMEKNLFEAENFKDWKVRYAEDIMQNRLGEVIGRRYEFESDYANLYLYFAPNIDL